MNRFRSGGLTHNLLTFSMRRFSILAVSITAVLVVLLAQLTSGAAAIRPSSSAQAAVSGPVNGGQVVGLAANVSAIGGGQTSTRLQQIATRAGARWLREEFRWSLIEPRRGRFAWKRYDHFMLDAARKGFHVLPLLVGAPKWSGPAWNSIPSNPAAFAAYTAAVVKRYGPHGTLWARHPALAAYGATTYEVWNEPYYPGGNNNRYDPARYIRLFKAAVTAGRGADPSTKYLLEADEAGRETKGGVWLTWINEIYRDEHNLNNYFDGVAIHPYGNDVTGLKAPAFNQLRRVELLRKYFVQHGASNKPLWITEVGWSTCTHGGPLCVSPNRQASDTRTLFKYVHSTWSSYVAGVFLFTFQDYGGNKSNPYDNYGLTRLNRSAKPALAAFRAGALG